MQPATDPPLRIEAPLRYPKPKDFKPEALFPTGHKRAGTKRCQEWSFRNGRQCGNSPVIGRRFCTTHNGKALMGPANPAWKGGRYSHALPARLAERYEELLADRNYLALRESIALTRTYIIEEAERLKDGEFDRDDARASWAEVEVAQMGKDAKKLAAALTVHAQIMHGGAGANKDKLLQWLDMENKQAATEVKTLQAAMQYVSIEQVLAQHAALYDILHRKIADRRLLGEVIREMEGILRR